MSFEDLAGRVPGVLALRTVKDGDAVAEVHVLVAPGAPADDIARSIRSVALLSDVDLTPERLHIVQLDAVNGEPPPGVEAPGAAPDVTGEGADDAEAADLFDIDLVDPVRSALDAPLRPRLMAVEVQVADGVGRAEVEIAFGIRRERGVAEFVPTTPTERRAVAEATVLALVAVVAWRGTLAVDTAMVVSLPNLDVALVTLASVAGEERALVGAAPVEDGGVHHALARATLDATNREVARRRSATGR